MKSEQEGITKVKVKRHSERNIFLRQGIGDGEINGEKFDIALNIDGKAMLWYFHDEARYYSVRTGDLTVAVLKFREELLKKVDTKKEESGKEEQI